MSKLDFNEESEKDLVEQVFNNAIDSLAEEDKTLPQVVSILPLLKRGIGIHHGGLLPILKEIIEILFQEGLLKCLFATETFSIGKQHILSVSVCVVSQFMLVFYVSFVC